MALGTDKTKIWSLCEVFRCEPGTVPFSIDVHTSCSCGQDKWNRVFCLDTRRVRSVENHVPAADCATVRRRAAGIVTLKTEIALQLSSIQKQA